MRKPRFIFFFVSVFVVSFFLLSGCHRKENIKVSYWPSLNKEADRWTDSLEIEVNGELRGKKLRSFVAKLDSLAATSRNQQIKVRALYWRGRFARMENYESGIQMLDSALSLCDSVKFPYDAARITQLMCRNMEARPKYELLLHNLKVYRDAGDVYFEAETLNRIGALLGEFNDYESAIDVYKRVEEITRGRWPQENYWSAYNIALNYERLGKHKECDAIVDTLINVQVDHGIKEECLFAISRLRSENDPSRIYKVRSELLPDTLTTHRQMWVSALMDAELIGYYLAPSHYNQDSASVIIKRLELSAFHDMPRYDRVLNARLKYYQGIKQTDSVASIKQQIDDYATARRYEQESVQLQRERQKVFVENIQDNLEDGYRNKVVIWWGVATLLLMVAFVLFYRWRMAKNHIRLTVKNYDNELQIAKSEITRLEVEHSQINPEIAAMLKQSGDWENFAAVFSSAQPLFMDKLRQDYPKLSASDLRLAAMLKAGLDSKQIAGILGIAPDSVKKARWRLRSKLGMETGSSFEDFFRSL